MAKTSIEWTDKVWNPIRGCSRVSAGCERCYAERVAARFSGAGLPFEGLATMTKNGPRWSGKIKPVPEHLEDPLRWRQPCRIFVNSMSDLFHENLDEATIDRVFEIMMFSPRHTFQVLTKRADRMLHYMIGAKERLVGRRLVQWPLPNIWLGVSVENQKTADERIPLLLKTPAAVWFTSAEPLLGPINLGMATFGLDNRIQKHSFLDWVIVGGESGPGARACEVEWIRQIVAQCKASMVPVFVKQLGAHPYFSNTGNTLTLKDRKGGDMSKWPEDLKVREFPAGTRFLQHKVLC